MRDCGLGVEIDTEARRAATEPDDPAEIAEGKARALMDWLQEQTNRVLQIRKREDRDLDRVRIRLEEVGYRPVDRSIDSYRDGPALVLHGSGTILTDTAAEAPLPQDRYLIPLAGCEVVRADGGGIDVRTDRATYSISPDNSDPA